MPDIQMCVRKIDISKTCNIRVIVELNIKVMVFLDATPCSLINTAVLEKNALYVLGVE
jgi:hypothetical protein